MRISEIYSLNKSQAELDFVDIDTTIDTPLFLDPFYLSKRTDRWSIDATTLLRTFFEEVVRLIRADEIEAAKDLFDHLSEPNSTCLGVSRADPRGRGVGKIDTDNIFESLIASRAIQTGLLNNIEDSVLFVERFGKDKLSDMSTNILTLKLVEYTIGQCNLHGIPLRADVPTGFYWDSQSRKWLSGYAEGLIIDNRKILLIPKGIVSFCKAYTPEQYYNHFVLDFLQNEHLRIRSALVQERRDGRIYVTKRSIEEENPFSKAFLRRFSSEHPEVLQQFKNETEVDPLEDQEIATVSISRVTSALIDQLRQIPSGNDSASAYHNLIKGALEIIFYPHLINPKKEVEINEGRKRIDIVFDNAAQSGIFRRFSENMGLPSAYIFVECKNYSRDLANPELDQIAGRFHINRGKVGFIICRNIEEFNTFIQRCRDTYHAQQGLVIPLQDEDIITLLQHQGNEDGDAVEAFLANRVRSIVMG